MLPFANHLRLVLIKCAVEPSINAKDYKIPLLFAFEENNIEIAIFLIDIFNANCNIVNIYLIELVILLWMLWWILL